MKQKSITLKLKSLSREQLSELYSQSTLWLKRLESGVAWIIHTLMHKISKNSALSLCFITKRKPFYAISSFSEETFLKLHISKTKWTYDKLCSRSTFNKVLFENRVQCTLQLPVASCTFIKNFIYNFRLSTYGNARKILFIRLRYK